jgi:hypothetical protein
VCTARYNEYLSLPEGYELVAGTVSYNMVWYYEFVRTATLTSPQGSMLIHSIPLKDVYRQFELYRMIVFPTHIFSNTSVPFNAKKDYYAFNVLQRTYLALSENELLQCRGRELKVWPANQPVYSTEIKTCSLSLYLQLENVLETCCRIVSTKSPPPMLEVLEI